MQGILKSNHERLCDCLQEIKSNLPHEDHKLNELDMELRSVFMSYLQKRNELKQLILMYEEKEKSVKYELKRIRKYENALLKKTGEVELRKTAF